MKPIPKRRIRNSSFWKPDLTKGNRIKTNAWFNISVKKNDNLAQTQKVQTSKVFRCRRVDIRPNHRQRNILKTWLEIYRQVYNITIHYFRSHKLIGKFKARDIIRKKINKNEYLTGLIKNSCIPAHTVNNAIFDVTKAYKSAFSNLKNRNINHFRLRYKKYNKPTQILVLEPNVFNVNGKGFKTKKYIKRRNKKRNLIDLTDLKPTKTLKVKHDVRLQFNKRTNKFILYIPSLKTTTTRRNRYNRCALDPGMRTFQTVYSDAGICYQICSDKTNGIIKKLIKKIEDIKDKKMQPWYKRYTNRIRERIKNVTTDLHWKSAKFLCQRFDNILIGNMSTKGIIKSNGSILSPTQKRFCIALSHYTFRLRLESKCQEYLVNYKCVDESYTSKTCGGCGEIYNNLGSAEVFRCPRAECQYIMNRDIHGARNILIKHTKN